MMRRIILSAAASALMLLPATASAGSDREEALLLAKLAGRRHTLEAAIRQAERTHGQAISAKFELKGSELMVSVYTAQRGRDADAEHNVLMELIGPASGPTWQPEIEVFEDVAHVSRSAMQLTLLQLSTRSLADAIARAESQRAGTAYSAIPAVRDGRPVIEVRLATPDGKSHGVTIDLLEETGVGPGEHATRRPRASRSAHLELERYTRRDARSEPQMRGHSMTRTARSLLRR